jgi:hypothetical protein
MALELIQTKTLASSSALVEFDTLPTTFKDLKVIITGRGTSSQNRVVIFLRVNNDSSNSNYTQFDWYFEDGSSGGEYSNGTSRSRIIGIVPCANATSSSSYGIADIWINNYQNTTNFKQFNSLLCSYQTTASWDNWNNAVVWRNTNAITNLSFETETGSFAAGSTFHLYGLK